MANAKETMNALSKSADKSAQVAEQKNLKQYIEIMKPQIEKALPSVITPERFTRIALTAISANSQLAQSTPQSFLGAMMNAAQLGLEPNTPLGQAYLIPFRNNKKGGAIETQFQIGYKGLIDLAHRSGEFKTIYAETVYENDEFDYQFGDDPYIKHKPALTDRGKPIAYYAVYQLVNGGIGRVVMSRDDVEKHAKKFSKTYNNGPWRTDFDAMARKTAIKQLLKYAPIKTEFSRGVSADETITKAEKSSDDDALDMTDISYVDAEYTVDEDGVIEDNKDGEEQNK